MKEVVFLFDESGYAGLPWLEKKFVVHCFDIDNNDTMKNGIYFHKWDAFDKSSIDRLKLEFSPLFVMGFPPCTDLAVSGARHFETKKKRDPFYLEKAMELVYVTKEIGDYFNVPWVLENPVSVISTVWRKPDHIFHPFEYGGYLPEDDVHPEYPEYILPRDAYRKKTCYWSGNGFIMPEKKPVDVEKGWSLQQRKLGGKSKKTKRIRSLSPRGIAKAISEVNRV